MEKNMIVSTGDINKNYEIIGPVYFQVSNKPEGFSPSTLSEYKEIYIKEVEQLKQSGKVEEIQNGSVKWECVFGEWCLGQSSFEIAFFIAVEELKKRGRMLGADGIIFMRQDIDLDKEAFQYFYLQMYGTAVRFI
jgi:hypothetical protein